MVEVCYVKLVYHGFRNYSTYSIALDKSGYRDDIFLISPQKHMLWVIIRSASQKY